MNSWTFHTSLLCFNKIREDADSKCFLIKIGEKPKGGWDFFLNVDADRKTEVHLLDPEQNGKPAYMLFKIGYLASLALLLFQAAITLCKLII